MLGFDYCRHRQTTFVVAILYAVLCTCVKIYKTSAFVFRVRCLLPQTKKRQTPFLQSTALFSQLFFFWFWSLFWRQHPVYEVFVVGVPSNYSLWVSDGNFSYMRMLLNYVLGRSTNVFICYFILAKKKRPLFFSLYHLLSQNNVIFGIYRKRQSLGKEGLTF